MLCRFTALHRGVIPGAFNTILITVSSGCPRCRSLYVVMLLEISSRCFFSCGKCGHKWNALKGSDEAAPRALSVPGDSTPRNVPRVTDRRAQSGS